MQPDYKELEQQIQKLLQSELERIKAEKALQKSEEKYRILFENAGEVLMVAQEGLIKLVNRRVFELIGYMPEAVMETSFIDYIHPEDREMVAQRHMRRMQGEDFFRVYQFRVVDKNRQTKWVRINAVRIEWEGKPATLNFLSDISDRVRTEAALQESEEKYRSLVEQAMEGILFAAGPPPKLVFVNRSFAGMFGYTVGELMSMTSEQLYALIHPEDRKTIIERFKDRISGKKLTSHYEFRGVTKNGKKIWLQMSSNVVNYLGKTAVQVVCTDITERKRAEKDLHQSEERYRSLVENTLDGYVVCEIPSGRFIFLNSRCCDLFRYTMQEALRLTIWDGIDPAEHKTIQSRIRQRIDGIKPAFASNIYTAVRKDGSKFDAEVSTSLITYHGKMMLQGVVRDVTEKRRLQRQLQEARKMEAIGTLAGGIAHDFNNLLMGIQGRVSLMAHDLDACHPHCEHLEEIEEYIKSATDLTRQLLGFARGGKYEVKPIDINKLLIDSSAMFGRTRKEIQIHAESLQSPLIVEADRRQLEQALLNLYVNAWQAMPDGGSLYLKSETVRLDDDHCRLHQVMPGSYVKMSVIDTGIGMDEPTRQRIFDPFFTTKGKGRGTGMGLASAQGIIKNHGGFVTVYSEIGHGTTFDIYLPISEKEAFQPKMPERTTVSGTETILLVDDERMIVEVGEALLKSLGYKVVTTGDGRRAVDAVIEMGDDIDLVILDIIMPGLDGGRTFDRIRGIRPDMPVLLSSGYAIDGKAQEILNRGCNGFIQKPFNISELSQKIRSVLDEANSPPLKDPA